jgi:hypothetical protein
MSRNATRRLKAPRSLIAVILALFVTAPSVRAQEKKSVVVSFASASATRNGYLHAQIRLTYTFAPCSSVPTLVFAREAGSSRGFEGYWYEGRMYGLKSSWKEPESPELLAELQVSFGAKPIPVDPIQNPRAGSVDCFAPPHTRALGKWSDFTTSPKMTQEEALKRFNFNVAQTKEPMRSPSVEAAIRAEIAAANQKARLDSVEKARLARVEQARKDSVARAQQARTTTSGTSTSGTATTATTAPTPVGATTTSTASRPRTEAERKADEQREADERARAVIAQLEAQQAAREEQNRQVEAATQQVAGMVGGILAARAEEQERKRLREVAAYERYTAYQTRVARTYAALPSRPACTQADTMPALTIESTVSGAIIGSECRLADSSSAHMYPLHIAKKTKVEITATGQFYPQLAVATLGTPSVTVLAAPDTGVVPISKVHDFLTPGDYMVIVRTRLPGETGSYTVKTEKGELSRTKKWALGMYVGPISGTFEGVAEEQDFGNVGGFRGTAAINSLLHLQAVWGSVDGSAEMSYTDVGARIYLGKRSQAFRPMFDVVYGFRKMFADRGFTGDYYSGTGMTYAAGVEWFVSPVMGAELTFAQVTGMMNIDEPTAGVSPTIDFGHTAIRLGFMFHR